MDNSSYNIEEVYPNLGEELSGSTVADVYGRTILIGSVFEAHFSIVSTNDILIIIYFLCLCPHR